MLKEFAEGSVVIVPLFVGFAVHGLCIRMGLLRRFDHPISIRLFGANKTYRGIVCVALGTALGFVLVRPHLSQERTILPTATLGFAVGAAAMLAELPNSFIKRRCGIAPGAQASGMRGAAFHVIDQVDVVAGAWAVLAWQLVPTWARIAGSLATMYVGHQVISIVGYWLGMRKTAR